MLIWLFNWRQNFFMGLLVTLALISFIPQTSQLLDGWWVEQKQRLSGTSLQVVRRKATLPGWYARLKSLRPGWWVRVRDGLLLWVVYRMLVAIGQVWFWLLLWFISQTCSERNRTMMSQAIAPLQFRWVGELAEPAATIGVQVVVLEAASSEDKSFSGGFQVLEPTEDVVENEIETALLFPLAAPIVPEKQVVQIEQQSIIALTTAPPFPQTLSGFSLSGEIREALQHAAEHLKGSARRLFMAKTVKALGSGGQRQAERELGWHRGTIRKGQQELKNGPVADNFSARGRKKAEKHLHTLLEDIQSIVEPTSQADPTFKTTRLYTPLTAKEVRQRLIDDKDYTDEQLPTRRTISAKLNDLGFHPQKVAKSKPLKKIPETDAIFKQIKKINRAADKEPGVLRLSADTKATIKVGPFSRGGKSRQNVTALDHDFKAETTLTAFGIFLPAYAETFIDFTQSKVTADFMVDALERLWPTLKARFEPHTLVINLDNGPENSSRRTQFIKRMVEFAHKHNVTIRLAYYPPYHSKLVVSVAEPYNPVERVWGIMENHWNGELLDEIDKILGLARTMTYKGTHPVVQLAEGVYPTGIKLTKKEMKGYEAMIERVSGLENWFVDIPPCPS